MERDIQAWLVVLRQYANLKPYKSLKPLVGYLENCKQTGELLPDPYIGQWRQSLRYLARRAHERHQLLLVSLYYELGACERDRAAG